MRIQYSLRRMRCTAESRARNGAVPHAGNWPTFYLEAKRWASGDSQGASRGKSPTTTGSMRSCWGETSRKCDLEDRCEQTACPLYLKPCQTLVAKYLSQKCCGLRAKHMYKECCSPCPTYLLPKLQWTQNQASIQQVWLHG